MKERTEANWAQLKVQFLINHQIKQRVSPYLWAALLLACSPRPVSSFHTLTAWTNICPSGSISWVTATPADVVKSRMQADDRLQRKYRGILHCIIQSYKTEGAQVSDSARCTERQAGTLQWWQSLLSCLQETRLVSAAAALNEETV